VTAKREQLSADRIAEVALEFVDAEGLTAFSFRALAKRLGCEAMSVYHYYPSKTHLYDAMLNICMAEILAFERKGDWLQQLRAFAHAFRATALRHPGFYPYIAVHRLNTGPALVVLNGILKQLEDAGQDAEWRASRFRALGYYITGALLDETSGYSRGPTAANPVPADVVAREYPSVVAVGPYFAPSYHLATFEYGLETLLRQIADEANYGPTPT
jgi:AcrR family transcriptional regulator